ncbi:MAG: anti-sigma F factor [Oscillospiraceae bacterium]|nr:anti-sigma F factor [Oscillospiraceae bacterium]MDE5853325.1 anti-sigma F factor [Oscillospiraceae bacterium]
MLVKNEMKLQIPSRSSNESFARVAIASFFAQLDPTVDEIADIKTAVSEAVTNSIVHAYKNQIGTIFMHAKILDDSKVYIRIRDKGCGIEDIDQAMEPMFTTCKTGERAGLGFAVMESFMDKLRVTSKPGKGTTVVLIKTLKKRI